MAEITESAGLCILKHIASAKCPNTTGLSLGNSQNDLEQRLNAHSSEYRQPNTILMAL